MSFKVGDRVYKARAHNDQYYCRWGGLSKQECPIGSTGTITIVNGENHFVLFDHLSKHHNVGPDELEYECRKAGFMRRRFVLLKDSPEVKAGALFEEKCDDGTQDFICINYSEYRQSLNTFSQCVYPRKVVLEMAEWFEEVKPLWVRVADLSIFEDMLKKHKTAQ